MDLPLVICCFFGERGPFLVQSFLFNCLDLFRGHGELCRNYIARGNHRGSLVLDFNEGTEDFTAQIAQFQKAITPGVAAVRAQSAGKDYDKEAFNLLLSLLGPYDRMANLAYPFLVPPAQPEVSRDNWIKIGLSLMETARSGEVHPGLI